MNIPQAVRIGVEHHQAGRLSDAERIYRQVLLLDPNNPDALHLLGVIAHQVGKDEIAVQLIDKAIRYRPSIPDYLNNLGEANRGLGRLQDAIASYDRALAIRPDYVDALNNRGIALQGLERYDEAIASFRKALSLKPDSPETHNNLGNTLYGRGRLDEAIASYREALSCKPDYAEAHNSLGNALYKQGKLDEAIASFHRTLSFTPDHADAHWNLALCRLLLGDYAHGWKEYEWRWEITQIKVDKRDFPYPLWLGTESLAGKKILLHAEQGLGDTLQFCRYAPMVAALGASVELEVQSALKPLLAGLQGVSRLFAKGEALPACDYHCPLLSLPLAFGTTTDSIPAAIPYIRADAGLVRHWRGRLGDRRGPRIGLAWSATSQFTYGVARSIPLSEFAKLIPQGAQCVSLQKDLSDEDRGFIEGRADIVHVGTGFADTAALVELMDVVVRVDTSIAHLAGAMGKAVWVLLPFMGDWRWLRDRADSAWYPTARLFRQTAIGDWSSVVRSVNAELARQFEVSV